MVNNKILREKTTTTLRRQTAKPKPMTASEAIEISSTTDIVAEINSWLAKVKAEKPGHSRRGDSRDLPTTIDVASTDAFPTPPRIGTVIQRSDRENARKTAIFATPLPPPPPEPLLQPNSDPADTGRSGAWHNSGGTVFRDPYGTPIQGPHATRWLLDLAIFARWQITIPAKIRQSRLKFRRFKKGRGVM